MRLATNWRQVDGDWQPLSFVLAPDWNRIDTELALDWPQIGYGLAIDLHWIGTESFRPGSPLASE